MKARILVTLAFLTVLAYGIVRLAVMFRAATDGLAG